MPFDERYVEQSERDEEAAKDRAIAEPRRDDNPDAIWDGDIAYCAECGELNTARARIGRGRCIQCQERADGVRG